jgi:hypothetical protein
LTPDPSSSESPQRDALKLVDYKLDLLAEHLRRSQLLLNDLRTLRRLLDRERSDGMAPAAVS